MQVFPLPMLRSTRLFSNPLVAANSNLYILTHFIDVYT